VNPKFLNVLTVGLLLTGCGGCANGIGENDGGSGADAGRDTGPAASPDASPEPKVDGGNADASDGGVSIDGGARARDAGIPGPTDPYPAGLCPSAPVPAEVPPGWQRYDGWSCSCPLYIPTDLAEPVEPMTWEPCPLPIPSFTQCRRMVRHTQFGGYFEVTAFPEFHREPSSGRSFLQFGRVFTEGAQSRLRLIAELDGPIMQAFLQTTKPGVVELADNGVTDSRYSFKVWGEGQGNDGIIAGRIDERYPDFIRTKLDSTIASWWPTSTWFVTTSGQINIETWNGSWSTVLTNVPVPIHRFASTSSALFFEFGDLYVNGVYVWSPEGGSKPFLYWEGDWNQRAGDLATDGKDMVWLYASRKLANGYEDPSSMELRAAPYTADPEEAELTSRRVAPFPYGLSHWPLVVGCGYVAASRYVPGIAAGPSLLVYRLSDDAAFVMPTSQTPGDWQIDGILGIHCKADGSEPEVIASMANVRAWGPEGVGTYVRFPISAIEANPFDGGTMP